jgi:outer membrane protein OmpA-like peptidoglycan-associated protein
MKSDLSPEHYVKLGDFIQLMADNSSLIIEIYGFTDTRGEEKENLDLSKDRALSILKFFLDNFVQTQRMTITGFGESKSAVEKNDEELRNNRRAEVKLYELSESN